MKTLENKITQLSDKMLIEVAEGLVINTDEGSELVYATVIKEMEKRFDEEQLLEIYEKLDSILDAA